MKASYLTLSFMFLLALCNNALADWFDQQVSDVDRLEKRIEGLIHPENENFYKDEEMNYIETHIIRSTDVYSLTTPYYEYLKEYLSKHERLSKEVVSNICYASYAWSLAYKVSIGAIVDEKCRGNMIESGACSNFRKKDVYSGFRSFLDMHASLMKKYEKISESRDDVETAKAVLRGFTGVGLMSPDFWKSGPSPSTAKVVLEEYEKENISYFPLEWLSMIKEYIEVQETFYRSQEVLDRIIEIYKVKTNIADSDYYDQLQLINELKNYSSDSRILFSKYDQILRALVFDAPLIDLAFYSFLQYKAALYWKDDDEKIKLTLTNFIAIKQIGYMANPESIDTVLSIFEKIKSHFKESEIKAIGARVALQTDWTNVPKRLETRSIKNALVSKEDTQ